MTRVIKQHRAVELQGKRAGFFSRVRSPVASTSASCSRSCWASSSRAGRVGPDCQRHHPDPVAEPGGNGSGMVLIFTVYLALGWASTGRTIGKQVMGLRVVRATLSRSFRSQALGRGLLCAMFYPCLLLALFHRRNAGIEEMICRTVVVLRLDPRTERPPPACRPGAPRTRVRRGGGRVAPCSRAPRAGARGRRAARRCSPTGTPAPRVLRR